MLPGFNQYFRELMRLAQGHNIVTPVGMEPRTCRFGVRRSTKRHLVVWNDDDDDDDDGDDDDDDDDFDNHDDDGDGDDDDDDDDDGDDDDDDDDLSG